MYERKVTIYYCFIALSLIGFSISADVFCLPLTILFFLVCALSLIGLLHLMKEHERSEYRRHRSDSERYNEIEKRFEHIEMVLKQKADKPIKNNVRPGSRPSEAYKALLAGDGHDDRAED